MSKLTVTLIASIAAFSFGTAYAAGDKASTDGVTPSATTGAGATTGDKAGSSTDSMTKSMTKEDAVKHGMTEAQFMSADTNGDGKLDAQEQKAANIQSKSMSK